MSRELKHKLIQAVLTELAREKTTLVQAALVAREAATHEESIAEDKYDTRGLEASYLAGAQAKRAVELERMIFEIEHLDTRDQNSSGLIAVAALVELRINDQKPSRVFIVPFAAGLVFHWEGEKIQMVTPSSPLGQELIGRGSGEHFEIKVPSQSQDIEILGFC